MNAAFWRGRHVLVTGHTGFKGSWLTEWLVRSGSIVTGFSLPDASGDGFGERRAVDGVRSFYGDVRDERTIDAVMRESRPEIVVHMAAQALVRESYRDPVGTFSTNVLGTVHLLESVRSCDSVRVVVVVTSDKCYEQRNERRPFIEDDAMGGRDPYSASKGCTELATSAYRESFFRGAGSPKIFCARAGNVIGGGDWAKDRLVPDLIRAFRNGQPAVVRNPDATRPWQFVLDALHGYLLLAEAGWASDSLPPSWNFGPLPAESRPVRWIADAVAARWGDGATWISKSSGEVLREEQGLTLDSSRARTLLGWNPKLDLDTAVAWTSDCYRNDGASLVSKQIAKYSELVAE